jgi:hypothetical protein
MQLVVNAGLAHTFLLYIQLSLVSKLEDALGIFPVNCALLYAVRDFQTNQGCLQFNAS